MKKTLQLQQLNHKMSVLSDIKMVAPPPTGWINAIRTALGMSMQQLGNKLSITKQGVLDMEKREKEGAITIRSLRDIAQALDMQLVYGFVPNDDTIDDMINKRATALATKIVMRTAHTMKLEDQANSDLRIENAIRERAEDIVKEMPKILWD